MDKTTFAAFVADNGWTLADEGKGRRYVVTDSEGRELLVAAKLVEATDWAKSQARELARIEIEGAEDMGLLTTDDVPELLVPDTTQTMEQMLLRMRVDAAESHNEMVRRHNRMVENEGMRAVRSFSDVIKARTEAAFRD